jgi:hypothetical protein
MLILGDQRYAEMNAGPFNSLLLSMAKVCENSVLQIKESVQKKKKEYKTVSSQLDDISVIAQENNLYAAAFNDKGVDENKFDSRVARTNRFGVKYKIPGKKKNKYRIKQMEVQYG